MSKTIDSNEKGTKIYDGLLSKEERSHADKILEDLKITIPLIEDQLNKKFSSKNNLYRYYLGTELKKLIEKYEITSRERIYFWNEIKFLASKNNNRVIDRSKNRNDYEYCYILSRFEIETIKKLSWRQWSSLLDSTNIIKDTRIFNWLPQLEIKIKEEIWREFLKVLNIFIKNKDTIVYDNSEIYYIYNYIYKVVTLWEEFFEEFFHKNFNSMTKARGNKSTINKYKINFFKEALGIKYADNTLLKMELREIFKNIYLINL